MILSIKVAIGSVVTLVVVLILGWVAFPSMLRSKIKSMVNLTPNSELRTMYMDIPFPITFKVYAFNITNPFEVTKGAIPIVKEVGPYVYEEKRQKELVGADDEDADTMTFFDKQSFYFRPDLSGSLTGEELITIPHPMIVHRKTSDSGQTKTWITRYKTEAIVLTVLKEKPAMVNLVNKALNSIHNNPETPFLTATYNKIFFNGIIINCTVTDFPGKALCTLLKAEAKDLVHITEDIYKFSLFGPKNGTLRDKFKVKRGIQDYQDTGRLIELNDEPEMKIWGTKECNQYHGTEGTVFPALTPPGSDIQSFAAAFCRTITAKYSGNTKYDGLPVSIYKADFGDMTSPDQKCYCPNPGDKCWKKGVIDLTKCSAPIIVSLPHFYNCDESYIRGVEGMNPNQEDHEIRLLFEAMTGSPISAKNRVQFSMQILPVTNVSSMKTLPDALVPMFWIEESIDLNNTFTQPIKTLHATIKIVSIISWFILIGSIVGLVVAGFLYFTKRTQVEITPVKSGKPSKFDSNISMVNSISGGEMNHAMRED